MGTLAGFVQILLATLGLGHPPRSQPLPRPTAALASSPGLTPAVLTVAVDEPAVGMRCPLAAHPAAVTTIGIPGGVALLVTTPGSAEALRQQLHAIANTHNGILRTERLVRAASDGRSDGRSDRRSASPAARIGWITTESDARATDTPDGGVLAFTTRGDLAGLTDEVEAKAALLDRACAGAPAGGDDDRER